MLKLVLGNIQHKSKYIICGLHPSLVDTVVLESTE